MVHVTMRIAVVADVHGNLPALRAVSEQLNRERAQALVIAGDVAGGPLVRDCLELIAARPEPTHWIRGNGEREAVAAFDGEALADDETGRVAAWSAAQLDRHWRDQLAGWPIALELGGIVFCHGTPRSDDEILTRATPDEAIVEALADAGGRLVVGGHIHQQQLRRIDGRLHYANPGSVGIPYEGLPGAFWMVIDEGVPELRRTSYDVAAAVDELDKSGFADVDGYLRESLMEPADPDYVAAYFEYLAGRGEEPAEPA
jgi:putative phosphoesterase